MRIDDCITVIETVSDDLAMVSEILPDGDLRIIWVNDALCAATGYSPEELIGQHPGIFAGASPDPDVVTWLDDARAVRQRFRGTLPYHRKDGSVFWGDLQLTPWPAAAAACTHWVSLLRDITPDMELRDAFTEAKRTAVTAQERLWSAIEALPDAFVIFDAEDRMVMCNARYRDLFPETADVIRPGIGFEELMRIGLERGEYREAEGREEEWLEERLTHHANPTGPIDQELPGNRFLRVHEVKLPTGETVGSRVDITELKRQQQAIERHARALAAAMERAEHAARTDALTGLSNRRGHDIFMRRLETESTARDQSIAFLHIDLDRFKQINDTLGHPAGDYVLREVASILRRSVREGDHVARVGGDEFVVVMHDSNAERSAREVAERVIEACRAPVWFEGRPCHFGASVGIAVAPPGAPLTCLIDDADIALYEAKQGGRNRAALYAPALRNAAVDGKHLADGIRAALERDEIEPWFQAQFHTADRSLAGVEALARWRHPSRGLMLPDEFLPVVDKLDLLHEIDRQVCQKSLSAIADAQAAGFSVPKLSLNVSYRRLVSNGFEVVLEAMQPLPCRLAIELLESEDAETDGEGERLHWTLDALRERGFGIEIDDFGSSRASIMTLLHLRPDRIKLSRQLVASAGSYGPAATPLLRAIGDMASALEIGLTAKGVETDVEAAAMSEIGCDVIQGRLYSAPMPATRLAAWLVERVPPPSREAG